MKAPLFLLVALAITLPCLAQSYVTNYVAADPAFRRVGGQLYNTEKSVLWMPFEGDCVKVLTNGVIIQKFTMKQVYETIRPRVTANQSIGAYSGASAPVRRVVSEEKVPGQKVFIRNYPKSRAPVTGRVLTGKAIRMGTYEYNGDTLELWDYGTPNIAPVISRTDK